MKTLNRLDSMSATIIAAGILIAFCGTTFDWTTAALYEIFGTLMVIVGLFVKHLSYQKEILGLLKRHA